MNAKYGISAKAGEAIGKAIDNAAVENGRNVWSDLIYLKYVHYYKIYTT